MAWLVVGLWWWWFALAPLPETTPEWIQAARSTCFGSLPNGLPEGYGWLTLVGSPLLMLTALVFLWPQELIADFRRLKASAPGRGVLVALTILPAWLLLWGVQRVVTVTRDSASIFSANLEDSELPRDYPRGTQAAPPFVLVDQHGQTVTNQMLLGQKVILTFAFAHCQSVCPRLLATLDHALADTRSRPALVVVTLDPWRDTPGALPGLAQTFRLGPKDHVLSGPVEDVLRVIEAYKLPISRNPQNGDVNHPGMIFVLDSRGRLAYSFTDPPTAWIVQALERL